MPLRHYVLKLLNSNMRNGLQQRELLDLEDKLLTSLNSVPAWSAETSDEDGALPSPALARGLIRSQLLELLLLLHRRASHSATTPAFRDYTRHGRFNAAAGIIEQHKTLEKEYSLMIVMFRGDAFTAALSMCFDLCTPQPRTGMKQVPHDYEIMLTHLIDAFFLPSRISATIACDYVKTALNTMERRTKHVEGILRRYWLLANCLSLAESVCDPLNASKQEKKIADRVLSLVYLQSSLQADYSALGPMFGNADSVGSNLDNHGVLTLTNTLRLKAFRFHGANRKQSSCIYVVTDL